MVYPASTINEPSMGQCVYKAARAVLQRPTLSVHFEHGQWWVTELATGAQWSVVDSNNGFDFEQVTEGEEA